MQTHLAQDQQVAAAGVVATNSFAMTAEPAN